MSIHLILGPMFSGKSTKLINELLRYKSLGKFIFSIKPDIDNRYSETSITTHDGISIPACTTTKLMDVTVPYRTNVIGIDEAQFFEDLLPFIEKNKNLIIIVAGLDGDARQKKFGNIIDLIPIADTYTKSYAFCKVCQDGTPAPFTKSLYIIDPIHIGGDKEYVAVCKKHLF